MNGEERRVVCTHMLCGLQKSRSGEDLIQMWGRSTGLNRSVLKKNLGEDAKVKILIHHSDWDFAVSYHEIQREIMQDLQDGKGIPEVFDKVYAWSCNFVPFLRKRSIGSCWSLHFWKCFPPQSPSFQNEVRSLNICLILQVRRGSETRLLSPTRLLPQRIFRISPRSFLARNSSPGSMEENTIQRVRIKQTKVFCLHVMLR